jgi:hypothetical protein
MSPFPRSLANFLTKNVQDVAISDIALYGLNIRKEACDVRYESADHGHFSAVQADAATDLTMVMDRINFLTDKLFVRNRYIDHALP